MQRMHRLETTPLRSCLREPGKRGCSRPLHRQSALWIAAVVLALLAAYSATAQDVSLTAPQNVPPPPAPATAATPAAPAQGEEILTRGPIHEAFAETSPLNPEPGIVVPKTPPEPIDEVPPDEKPAGSDCVWIPGYWGWDQDRQDFLWVSGVWRIPPPRSQWVPGYWTPSDKGYQWTAGYWYYQNNPQQEHQIAYLPNPPASIEAGPSSPAPSTDYFWVPGCWIWRGSRFVWRAGYWTPGMAEWVWVPAHYLWTPAGAVFIPGHWDYTLPRRGILFAPAYFAPVVYMRPQFRYVPTVVINTGAIEATLFAWPHYCHYYFGDYYAPAYRTIGIVPWFTLYVDRRGYDPLFTYAYWRHGPRDPQWLAHLQHSYAYREKHQDARPPHTYHAFQQWMGNQHGGGHEPLHLAASLADAGRMEKLPFRMERVSPQQRNEISQSRQHMQQFTKQRSQLERDVHQQASRQPAQGPRAMQANLPRSPVTHSAAQSKGRDIRPDQRQTSQGHTTMPSNSGPTPSNAAGNNQQNHYSRGQQTTTQPTRQPAKAMPRNTQDADKSNRSRRGR